MKAFYDVIYTPSPYGGDSRRTKSRMKAQEKRERYATVMKELTDLLPFEESLKASFDKTTVLRLAVSYLKAKDHFGGGNGSKSKRASTSRRVVKKSDLESLIMPVGMGNSGFHFLINCNFLLRL